MGHIYSTDHVLPFNSVKIEIKAIGTGQYLSKEGLIFYRWKGKNDIYAIKRCRFHYWKLKYKHELFCSYQEYSYSFNWVPFTDVYHGFLRSKSTELQNLIFNIKNADRSFFEPSQLFTMMSNDGEIVFIIQFIHCIIKLEQDSRQLDIKWDIILFENSTYA